MTGTTPMPHATPARFATALAVEAYKLRRSLALLLAAVAPLLKCARLPSKRAPSAAKKK